MKKQITIRYDGDIYDAIKGELRYFSSNGEWDYRANCSEYDSAPTGIRVGAEFVVGSRRSVSPNAIRSGQQPINYFLSAGPIGGNSDPQITRYHGWRGTTNDVHVEALGLRRVKTVRKLRNGDFSVTFGQDLLPNEE